jgi:hypothetical protein
MSETVKKTTTKPKTTRKPKAEAEPKVAAKPRTKTATLNGIPSNVTTIRASHDQVAQLAHRFWIERGYQHGYDAEDWFRAEQQLRAKAS